jgi:hypothetical protein
MDASRGIKGTIRNDGPKTLKHARATATFLDKDGNRTGEYEFSVLGWSGRSGFYDNKDKPLAAEGSQDFWVYPSSVPEGWSERYEVRVTSVEFEREKEKEAR